VVRPKGEGFPRKYRIVKSSEYRSLYGRGKRLQAQRFVLYRRENNLEHHRLGITVSRKIGRAVVRNRIKRLFREIFRRNRAEIPHHYDFVVNAKQGCAGATYSELRKEFLATVLGNGR